MKTILITMLISLSTLAFASNYDTESESVKLASSSVEVSL